MGRIVLQSLVPGFFCPALYVCEIHAFLHVAVIYSRPLLWFEQFFDLHNFCIHFMDAHLARLPFGNVTQKCFCGHCWTCLLVSLCVCTCAYLHAFWWWDRSILFCPHIGLVSVWGGLAERSSMGSFVHCPASVPLGLPLGFYWGHVTFPGLVGSGH